MGWLTDYLHTGLARIDSCGKEDEPAADPILLSLEAFSRKSLRRLLCPAEGARQGGRGKIHAGKGTAGKDVCGAGKTA